eukprot:TRINITY_DN19266_c0_g1_i2.p1 TRINITY_DN19266_c0_g1~~TRINITY_DN19266_c0_g1_i2.p1  ORF type:complete len:475 (+),score=171.88 TRINITY_DN19266_c0_g1_i2:716-2140(+)
MAEAASELKGRCVVAKKDIPKGAVIFTDSTLMRPPEYLSARYNDPKQDPRSGVLDTARNVVSTTSPDLRHPLTKAPTQCAHCQKSLGGARALSQCDPCGTVYCSLACKSDAEQKYHKIECAVLREDPARLLRDRLVKIKELSPSSKLTGAQMFGRWQTVVRTCCMSLQQSAQWPASRPWFSYLSHREGEHVRFRKADGDRFVATGYGLLWLSCVLQFSECLRGPQYRERLDSNAFEREIERQFDLVYDKVKSNASPKTGAVYPFLSLVNHGCLPNAEISGGSLIAAEDIGAGQEITVSYVPKNIPTDLKYNYIKKTEGWTCHCLYCGLRFVEEFSREGHKMDQQGLKAWKERRTEREEFLSDAEYTSSGAMTARKIAEVQDAANKKHAERMQGYDNEFVAKMEETMLHVQNETDRMSPPELMQYLGDQKRKISKLERLGLVQLTDEEKRLYDTLEKRGLAKISQQTLERTGDEA